MFKRRPNRLHPIAAAVAIFLLSAAAHAAPKISCDNPTFDFGTKDAGESITATFTLKNDGDQPLQINSLNPNLAGSTIDTKTIAPATTGTVTIKLPLTSNGTGNGKLNRTIQLLSNDPAKPQLQLTLTGTVRFPLTIDPANIDFGSVNIADALPKILTLTAPDPSTKFQVRGTNGPDQFEYRTDPQPDGLSCKITVTPRKDILPVELRGSLSVTTDNAGFTTIQIPYSAKLDSDIHASAPGISIIRRANGVGQSLGMTISPAQPQTGFKVLASNLEGIQGGTPSITPADGGNWLVKITGVPKNVDLNGKFLVVNTDLARMKQVRIPIGDAGGRTASLAWGPATAEGLQMALQIPNQTFAPTAAIAATVHVRNVSDAPTRMPTLNASALTFEGTKADGTPVDLTAAGKTASTRPASTTSTPLGIGEVRSTSFTPKTYLDLTKEGTYTLKVKLSIPKAAGGTTVMESNAATIQIKEPPPPLPPGLP